MIDPYLQVSLGDETQDDCKHDEKQQINPSFGRSFEFKTIFPFNTLLTVRVLNRNVFIDELIGETIIDLENRFYSKHQACSGLQQEYLQIGCARWRHPKQPSQILESLCKTEGLPSPQYPGNGTCVIGTFISSATNDIIYTHHGTTVASNEPIALQALKEFALIPDKGYPLVPEHIETRKLYHPKKNGVIQGKMEMWVDLFPLDGPMPEPMMDISVQEPKGYELRVIVHNTNKIKAVDGNRFLGLTFSDIFVKGWLEGIRQDCQRTDVHYRSIDGTGLFNWRFVFPFKFCEQQKEIVTERNRHFYSTESIEERHQPILHIQVLDSDLIPPNQIIGHILIDLLRVKQPAKNLKLCTLENYKQEDKMRSLFKGAENQVIRGWWPLSSPDDPEDLCGKIELELALVSEFQASNHPVGRRRSAPEALKTPFRPPDSVRFCMSPLRIFHLLICNHKKLLFKMLLFKVLIGLLVTLLYAIPQSLFQRLTTS